MTFNSVQFGALLTVVFVVYWRLTGRSRLWLLLAASYIFYGYWDYRFLGLIALSTCVDYVVGRRLGEENDEGRRRRLLLVSVAINLGILGFFKYFNFFVDSATDLLASLGLSPNVPVLQILLPVGISFYTFQTLAYTIDVFRRRLVPVSDLLLFAVYVAFFPQLVAGPIERAHRLLPQLQRPARFSPALVRSGILLIGLGLIKKVVIADTIAQLANRTFGAESTTSWIGLTLGVYAFAIQIYGDFSGYTDIARGTARLLGIELVQNFSQPYLSRSITEFWRRWHMSLSSWLLDYLYIPLGGNRGTRLLTYRNLMLTMILGGLWHGAAWTFVVWGTLHGLFLATERWIASGVRESLPDRVRWGDWGRILLTFHLVCLTWIPFRAGSLSQAWEYFVGIITLRGGEIPVEVMLLLPFGLGTIGLDLVLRSGVTVRRFGQFEGARFGVAVGIAAVLIIIYSGGPVQPFVYFQF
jgi:alginate O-acetyltransferase complex protein AlgI